MKLKMLVIDFQIPMQIKRLALRAGIPIAMLSVAAVAWGAPLHTWVQGDTLSAADLNGDFDNLQGQITTAKYGLRTPSAFRATLTNALTTNDNVASTVVCDSVQYDLASEYDKTTGKFTVHQGGVYFASCQLSFDVVNVDFSVTILRNGIGIANATARSGSPSTGEQPNVATTIDLAAGDSLTCIAYQNSGVTEPLYLANAAIPTSFTAARIY